jgi:hypothetical protein
MMKSALSHFRFLLAAAALLGCVSLPARAQTPQADEQDEGRGIVPVFSNARAGSNAATASTKAAPVYRKIARPPRRKPSRKPAGPGRTNRPDAGTAEPILTRGRNNSPSAAWPTLSLDAARNLGVTVWKLQPDRAFADFNQPACRDAARLTGQGVGRDLGQPTMLAPPVRSSSETLFRTGDRIRLSIESTRPGYLYIVTREFYADGGFGPPKLIFPTARIRGGNNYLAPGSPVEFPDLCDNVNYFELLPALRPRGLVAEALIMIVADKPLAEVGVPRDALPVPESWLAAWEARWPPRTQVYELDQGEGQPYTTGELNAGFEIRRQGRPGALALGQGGPQPQTIYSADARGDGMMTTVLLWYE